MDQSAGTPENDQATLAESEVERPRGGGVQKSAVKRTDHRVSESKPRQKIRSPGSKGSNSKAPGLQIIDTEGNSGWSRPEKISSTSGARS